MSSINNRYGGGNRSLNTNTLALGNKPPPSTQSNSSQVAGAKSASSASVRGVSPDIRKEELFRAIRLLENLGGEGVKFDFLGFEYNNRNDSHITRKEFEAGYTFLIQALKEQPLENGLRKLLALDDTCAEALGRNNLSNANVQGYYTRMSKVIGHMYENFKKYAGADGMMSPDDIEKLWK